MTSSSTEWLAGLVWVANGSCMKQESGLLNSGREENYGKNKVSWRTLTFWSKSNEVKFSFYASQKMSHFWKSFWSYFFGPTQSLFMPPTGHIGLGLSVCPSICLLHVAHGQAWLEIGSWNLIFGMCMKNKRTHIFFSFPSDLSLLSYAPFSVNICLNYIPFPTLVSCVVKQSCQQNTWRTAWARILTSCILFGYMMQMTWLMFLKFCEYLTEFLMPLFRNFSHRGHCEQNVWITTWARIMIFGTQIVFSRCRWPE